MVPDLAAIYCKGRPTGDTPAVVGGITFTVFDALHDLWVGLSTHALVAALCAKCPAQYFTQAELDRFEADVNAISTALDDLTTAEGEATDAAVALTDGQLAVLGKLGGFTVASDAFVLATAIEASTAATLATATSNKALTVAAKSDATTAHTTANTTKTNATTAHNNAVEALAADPLNETLIAAELSTRHTLAVATHYEIVTAATLAAATAADTAAGTAKTNATTAHDNAVSDLSDASDALATATTELATARSDIAADQATAAEKALEALSIRVILALGSTINPVRNGKTNPWL